MKRYKMTHALCISSFILCWLLMVFPQASEAKRSILNLKSRHHRDVQLSTPEPPELTAVPLLEDDPCLSHYCTSGRECKVHSGIPICECSKKCVPHHHVCGSDGNIYKSHCHMHSTACQNKEKLVQMDMNFCEKNQEMQSDQPKLNKSDIRQLFDNLAINKTKPKPANIKVPDYYYEDYTLEPEYQYLRKRNCAMEVYEVMKDNLLMYYHSKFTGNDKNKDYVQSLMFSRFDKNKDGRLEEWELNEASTDDPDLMDVLRLSHGCKLASLIYFDDTDGDDKLTSSEFSVAMSKLYTNRYTRLLQQGLITAQNVTKGSSKFRGTCPLLVSLDKALEVNWVPVRLGDSVELHCAVSGSPVPPVIWRRHGQDLANLDQEDVKVYGDGSLYLAKVALEHAGNYTCSAQRNPMLVQTHILLVNTLPEVRVVPKYQSKRPGEDAEMFCHVSGEPMPNVTWLKNDQQIPSVQFGDEDSHSKFEIVGNGTSLKIRKIEYADTGAYMCKAINSGGTTMDISSLVVQDQPTAQGTLIEEQRFFAFHELGISIYDPAACRLHHIIKGTDIIPGTEEYVCGNQKANCSWGRAVSISDRYIYASQPLLDRILVVSTTQMAVVDVVGTDKYPVELEKVLHLDQLWLVSWRNKNETGSKTIQVIRDAGQKRKHHTVHPEPIDGQFDMVKQLFLPTPFEEISHYKYKYGYVTHTNQRGVYKLDLENLRYIRSVDLTPYNCVPEEIQFSALYGYVFMECKEPVTKKPTGMLILDYLSDAVILPPSKSERFYGKPYVSPDSRKLVTFNVKLGGTVLSIHDIISEGVKFRFDIRTSLNVSDLAFYPSQTSHGYDVYASSLNKSDLLYINLDTGKVKVIVGVGESPNKSKWNNPIRPITTAGRFGTFLATPSNNALFIINGKSRTINCEISALNNPSHIVWITQIYH
ncbi:follistatin-related protein 4-like isoform X2 [Anthonomus grandis grandis]|uniref:follistatin-related protein 4-like isoform X2 n=1 Tax=Anthonomus grandis grandis TaxID=2921223 RepID=UPI0021658FEC|nr:follistatin-related protein 4-like isoform X2 [Anthonomus grandis grandis]